MGEARISWVALVSVGVALALVAACGGADDDIVTTPPDASAGDGGDGGAGSDAARVGDAPAPRDATTMLDTGVDAPPDGAPPPADAPASGDAPASSDAPADAPAARDAPADAACKTCDDANPCTTDTCTPSGCTHAPANGGSCFAATSGGYVYGICSGGACCTGCLDTGGACQPGNVGGICGQSGAACSACAAGAACIAGSCASSVSVAGAGVVSLGPDVDGDGLGDLLVGAETASPSGMAGAGQVTLYSGATLALLRTWNGENAGDALGGSISLGPDVDGDGHADVFAGARHFNSSAGKAYLFSGATGALLCSWTGTATNQLVGHMVSLGPDADGDGRGDALTGTGSAGGFVTLYSGKTCGKLWDIATVAASISLGPDTNGDGRGDALLGNTANGFLTVYSGATGAQLVQVSKGLGFGASVCLGPDATGDGLGDIVGSNPTWGGNEDGLVEEFNGNTGAFVNSWQGNEQALGEAVVLGPDADGDGKGDVLIEVPGYLNASPKVMLESGSSNATIRQWSGSYVAITLGPDADGDGKGDVAVVEKNGPVVLFASKTW